MYMHGGRGHSSTPGLGPMPRVQDLRKHIWGSGQGAIGLAHPAGHRKTFMLWFVEAGGELPIISLPPIPESPQLED